VGDYTREIGLALHDLGCDVHVATSAGGGPARDLNIHPDVKRWSWGCWGTLVDLVRRERPDVVHIQYQAAAYGMHPAVNLLPRRLRRMGGRPRLAVTFHDLKVPYLFPKAGQLRRWVVNELARQCDAAITTNQEDYEHLRWELKTAGSSGPLLPLIPIGSNIARRLPAGYDRNAWRARWGAGTGDLLLCFFGFVNDRKGVDSLIRALKLLCDERSVSPLLLFIGGQTGTSDPTNVANFAQIKALIAELGLEDRVRWTGYVPAEEVSASFLAADLCVLPFRDGVSFLHGTFHAALAHGVPILTTRPRVPLPELVDGENILLGPAQDPQALAVAITELAGDPGLRERLGEGALRLSEQFRWEKIAADTLELYRAMGAGR
jgi:glycosyltransferase involved in cell wall biosynthesis